MTAPAASFMTSAPLNFKAHIPKQKRRHSKSTRKSAPPSDGDDDSKPSSTAERKKLEKKSTKKSSKKASKRHSKKSKKYSSSTSASESDSDDSSPAEQVESNPLSTYLLPLPSLLIYYCPGGGKFPFNQTVKLEDFEKPQVSLGGFGSLFPNKFSQKYQLPKHK